MIYTWDQMAWNWPNMTPQTSLSILWNPWQKSPVPVGGAASVPAPLLLLHHWWGKANPRALSLELQGSDGHVGTAGYLGGYMGDVMGKWLINRSRAIIWEYWCYNGICNQESYTLEFSVWVCLDMGQKPSFSREPADQPWNFWGTLFSNKLLWYKL